MKRIYLVFVVLFIYFNANAQDDIGIEWSNKFSIAGGYLKKVLNKSSDDVLLHVKNGKKDVVELHKWPTGELISKTTMELIPQKNGKFEDHWSNRQNIYILNDEYYAIAFEFAGKPRTAFLQLYKFNRNSFNFDFIQTLAYGEALNINEVVFSITPIRSEGKDYLYMFFSRVPSSNKKTNWSHEFLINDAKGKLSKEEIKILPNYFPLNEDRPAEWKYIKFNGNCNTCEISRYFSTWIKNNGKDEIYKFGICKPENITPSDKKWIDSWSAEVPIEMHLFYGSSTDENYFADNYDNCEVFKNVAIKLYQVDYFHWLFLEDKVLLFIDNIKRTHVICLSFDGELIWNTEIVVGSKNRGRSQQHINREKTYYYSLGKKSMKLFFDNRFENFIATLDLSNGKVDLKDTNTSNLNYGNMKKINGIKCDELRGVEMPDGRLAIYNFGKKISLGFMIAE